MKKIGYIVPLAMLFLVLAFYPGCGGSRTVDIGGLKMSPVSVPTALSVPAPSTVPQAPEATAPPAIVRVPEPEPEPAPSTAPAVVASVPAETAPPAPAPPDDSCPT